MSFYALVKRNRRKIFSVAIVTLAIAYLLYATGPGLAPTVALLQNISVVSLCAAFGCTVMMLLLKAYYHLLLLRQVTQLPQRFSTVVPAYLQGQVVRYLPGKIWGLVYQSQQLKGQASAAAVVLVNLFQMLNTNLLAGGIIVSVIAGQLYGPFWLLLGLTINLILTELLHRFPKYEMMIVQFLAKCSKYFQHSLSMQQLPAIDYRGTAVLLAEWVFFLMVFYLLFHDSYAAVDVMLVAVWYAAASLIAILAIVVPAGLAVREAIFIAGSTMLPVDNSAFLAVAAILRLVFFSAEVFAIPVGIWLSKFVEND